MKGIRVTCTDLETGESESQEITDDYVVVTAGRYYVEHIQRYGNGTVLLTIKRDEATRPCDLTLLARAMR